MAQCPGRGSVQQAPVSVLVTDTLISVSHRLTTVGVLGSMGINVGWMAKIFASL